MKNFIKILLALALLGSSNAFSSQSASPVEVPEVITNSFEKEFLIGSATLKFLGAKVYDIYLWSALSKFSYDTPFAIHIKYNMSFSSQELLEKSIIEISNIHKLSEENKKIYYDTLKTIFHSVEKGDEKIVIFIPNEGLKMFYNNDLIGVILDPKLSRLFVDIWLDERGSYPKLTRKILGKN
jgi:hypothetical protein